MSDRPSLRALLDPVGIEWHHYQVPNAIDAFVASCYSLKVRKNAAWSVCARGRRKEIPRAGWTRRGDSQGQVKSAGQTSSRNRSLLAEGREHSHRRPRVPPPWRGYAGRKWETELTPHQDRFPGWTTDHRPGSRLRVERRQTRSSNLGLLCVCLAQTPSKTRTARRACAAVERAMKGF
jgi:hypothetical protein